uniref:Uncharacterized protein n=1 Tax=Molluscum contagiosum virus subtype 1 TaxID=10280 RepID=O11376_MCV1|nr:hypothetical protein [Molluscum contagiosum virus subtype 1]
MHIRVLVLWTGHRCGNFAPANERCIVQGNMYRLCIRSAKRQRKKKPNVIQKKQQTSFRRGKTFPAPSVVLWGAYFPFHLDTAGARRAAHAAARRARGHATTRGRQGAVS